MPTTAITDLLRTLHRHHRQLADLNGRRLAGPRQVAACRTQLAAAEKQLAEVQERTRELRKRADQQQLQLRSFEQKIVDLEGKRNACKTNREYQTLEEQIAADRMACRVLEDEILELLERTDAEKAGVPVAEAAVAKARVGLAAKEADVSRDQGEIDTELARVSASLADVEAELPADLRTGYDRVVRMKGAEGMAAVDGESCGGCYQQLTGNMLAELIMGRVVTCRSCGRWLYADASSSPSV